MRRLVMLAAIGVLLVLLVAGGLALLDWQPIGLADEAHLAAFVASLCVAGALWLLAVAIVRRGRLPPRTIWLVLGVAVAMRLLTLAAPPVLSSDLYRYVWDGRVQLAGINPYRYLPAADELAFLRDEAVYPHINRAEYALYGVSAGGAGDLRAGRRGDARRVRHEGDDRGVRRARDCCADHAAAHRPGAIRRNC